MREVGVSEIRAKVAELCVKANMSLPESVSESIAEAEKAEKSPLCRRVLAKTLENAEAAEKDGLPVCQDTGMAVVFLEIGQDAHIIGGDIYTAVNDGVADGYRAGYLRKSIAADPLFRQNTGDNTPAVIHTNIVPGDRIKITVAPKGFGSENMSAVKMFTPSADQEDIIAFAAETVSKAGSNPCPPVIIGVGLGGDFEYAAILAKKALCRDIAVRNPDERYAALERRMLSEINKLGIGAQGFGGTVTALAVNIEKFPTHIAGLPMAVNMGCYVTRHSSVIV